MKIVGIGNALVDKLHLLADDTLLSELHLDKGSMTLIDQATQHHIDHLLSSHSPRITPGGSAANTILALAHMGAQCAYIGMTGSDSMGALYASSMQEAGVQPHIIRSAQHTGIANTLISPDGQRTFATYLGAAAHLSPQDITTAMLDDASLLHLEGYLVQNHDLIEHICHIAKTKGLSISLDLGSYNIVSSDHDFFHHLVRTYVDIVFANQEEAQAYTHHDDPTQAISAILHDTHTAVVKLGAEGAISQTADMPHPIRVPAIHIDNLIDTTAAGDYFAAGYLWAYTQYKDIQTSLQTGTILASHIIQEVGAQLSPQTWDKILKVFF